jgi:hypothetical protein
MEQRRDLRDKVTAPCPVKAPPCCLPKIGTTVWEDEECERGKWNARSHRYPRPAALVLLELDHARRFPNGQ